MLWWESEDDGSGNGAGSFYRAIVREQGFEYDDGFLSWGKMEGNQVFEYDSSAPAGSTVAAEGGGWNKVHWKMADEEAPPPAAAAAPAEAVVDTIYQEPPAENAQQQAVANLLAFAPPSEAPAAPAPPPAAVNWTAEVIPGPIPGGPGIGYFVVGELPGVTLSDLSITFQNNVLHIVGGAPRPFHHQQPFPFLLHADRLQASFCDSTLRVQCLAPP
jgi:hypothetical protein